MLFKWCNALFLLIFLLSTAVQYNDPDPLRWFAVYSAAAALCLAQYLVTLPRSLAAILIAVCVVWIAVLLPQVVRVEGVRMAVNYGLESMRLPAPVPSGARLRMSAELKDVREMPNGGARATWGLVFEVEGGGKPACVADAIYVYFP